MSLLGRGPARAFTQGSFRRRTTIPRPRTLTTQASSPASTAKTALYAGAFAVSAGLFTVYYMDCRSAIHRYILTPLVRSTLDVEAGHKLAVKVLKYGVSPKDQVKDDPVLVGEIWGQEVNNPVGLAAGFDKDGEAIDGLFNLGFSWVEIGSVTPKPQEGNPKPRMFRLEEDDAVINRYGFPSQGHTYVLSRLQERSFEGQESEQASLRHGDLLAVNLGKNKDSPADSIDDFVRGVKTFGPYSDVLVINVSSPNTPGLRGLQNRDSLETLLRGAVKARDELPPSQITHKRPKLLVKLAPDLDELQLVEIADVIQQTKVDGVILSNTTIQRPNHLINANKHEVGGLSGPPVKPYALKALKTLRANLPASIPIIGCGGISSGQDALEFARAGATLVQLYTRFGYEGAGTARRIKDELVVELRKEGKTWKQVVAESVDKTSLKHSPLNDEVKLVESAVSQLIKEAEHLKALLGKLGEKIEKEAPLPPDHSIELGEAQASVLQT
ncbi:dihydroorotate dehydrogenase [Coprinopsis sp. MPI-PUGE-AT-0042]|nr:dihydroorotate dehydrogenase [Coprinopsis sp. MPI-PUGE-AT-0042]